MIAWRRLGRTVERALTAALRWARSPAAAPTLAALVTAVLMLGPALGPGIVLAYDMPWSPDPRFTPFALGVGTPAPRAVPGDAFVVSLGILVGAGLAQSVVLCGVLVGAALGVVAVLRRVRPEVSAWATVPAAVFAIWNPFVVERLIIGQWVILLGYAATAWALAALLSEPVAPWIPIVVGVASLGGANPWVMVMSVLLPGLLLTRAAGPATMRPSGRLVAAALLTAVGTAAVWAVPALSSAVEGDPAGATAFAPAADGPFGVLGSLISGGGMWNAAAHPPERGQPLLALAAIICSLGCALVALSSVWRLGRQGRTVLVVAAAPLVLVLLSSWPHARPAWRWLLGLTGAGVLRDSQKLLAVWVVLLAIGLGVLTDRVVRLLARARPARCQRGTWCAALATVAFTVAPVALLPSALWGLGGRLEAVQVPEGLRAGAAALSAAPQGVVGLLPWSQYRRFGWNDARISLTVMPRMIDQVVLFDDSLPLRSGRVGGEDTTAARVSSAIERGIDPVEALRAVAVTYVAVEKRSGLDLPESLVGERVVETPDLVVVRVGNPRPTPVSGSLRWGWGITLATWLIVLSGAAVSTGKSLRRQRPALIRSAP